MWPLICADDPDTAWPDCNLFDICEQEQHVCYHGNCRFIHLFLSINHMSIVKHGGLPTPLSYAVHIHSRAGLYKP